MNTNSDPNCDLYYEKNPALLTRVNTLSTTPCWYVKELSGGVASVSAAYAYGSGRTFFVNAKGKFNAHRPTTAQASPYQPDCAPTAEILSGTLSLGVSVVTNDMSFSHSINPGNFSGQVGYVQLIEGDGSGDIGYTSSSIGNGGEFISILDTELDGKYGEFPRGQPSIPANTNSTVSFWDAPSDGLFQDNARINMKFSTYLMFKPSGGIWVPLRLITWKLNDQAAYGVISGGASITSDSDSTAFPDWTSKFGQSWF